MSTQASNVSIKKEEVNGVPFPPIPNGSSNIETKSNEMESINNNDDDEELPQIKQESNGNELPTTQALDLDNTTNQINSLNLNEGQILPDQSDIKIINRQINGYVGFANLPKQCIEDQLKMVLH